MSQCCAGGGCRAYLWRRQAFLRRRNPRIRAGVSRVRTELFEKLFVQNAGHITLENGELTLDGVNSTVLFFSDRPERMGAHGLTTQFVEYRGKGGGTDGFAADPPNATLSIVTRDVQEDVVLTLANPRLVDDQMKYDVTIVEGDAHLSGGPGSLFIDVIGRPLTPVSVAGVRRRTRRRTAVAVGAAER